MGPECKNCNTIHIMQTVFIIFVYDTMYKIMILIKFILIKSIFICFAFLLNT